jgi:uncharacterized membrane protein YbhN (UPF0104 family)
VTARLLVRHHGVRILAVTLLGHLMLSVVLLVAVRVVGVEGVGWADTLVAFSLVRVAASVAPLPGGAGVTEVGLVTMLGGASRPDVVAAVMAYRACTFLLPIATGTLCVVAWRWRSRRRERALLAS